MSPDELAELLRQLDLDVFLSFFDNDVDRALIRHYSRGSGRTFTLTEAQMRDMGTVLFDLADRNLTPFLQRTARSWRQHVVPVESQWQTRHPETGAPLQFAFQEVAVGPRPVDFTAQGQNYGITGGLGNFTGRFRGQLKIFYILTRPLQGGAYSFADTRNEFQFSGNVAWEDDWDFDIQPPERTDRTQTGQERTLVGHYLLVGRGFPVRSACIPARQNYRGNDKDLYVILGEPPFPPPPEDIRDAAPGVPITW